MFHKIDRSWNLLAVLFVSNVDGCIQRVLDDLRQMGYTGLLEADGGVSMKNAATRRAHGLDVAVMGTAMFASEDPAADMAAIHAL